MPLAPLTPLTSSLCSYSPVALPVKKKQPGLVLAITFVMLISLRPGEQSIDSESKILAANMQMSICCYIFRPKILAANMQMSICCHIFWPKILATNMQMSICCQIFQLKILAANMQMSICCFFYSHL